MNHDEGVHENVMLPLEYPVAGQTKGLPGKGRPVRENVTFTPEDVRPSQGKCRMENRSLRLLKP